MVSQKEKLSILEQLEVTQLRFADKTTPDKVAEAKAERESLHKTPKSTIQTQDT
jgi:hypothetical protein